MREPSCWNRGAFSLLDGIPINKEQIIADRGG